jgi:hypothetical protein
MAPDEPQQQLPCHEGIWSACNAEEWKDMLLKDQRTFSNYLCKSSHCLFSQTTVPCPMCQPLYDKSAKMFLLQADWVTSPA